MESIWLGIVLFFLLLIIIPMIFRVYFSYNPLENSGLVVIKLWFIKIVYFTFELRVNSVIIRTKKERKQVEYQFSDPKIKFVEHLTLELKEKIKVRYLDLYSKVGLNDSYASALMSGIVNILYHVLASYIKNLKFNTTINVGSHTEFNEKVFVVSVFAKMSISIFDVLFCIFVSLFYGNKKSITKE